MLAWRVTARPSDIGTSLRSSRAASTARRVEQLLFLAALAAVVTASGQAPTWNPLTNMPPEKYDNPPAYIYRLDTSPRMVSPHGAFISYQANVDADGNNIVGDAANECSISVDPTDPSKMAIGWRQFDSVLSNFRQGGWGRSEEHTSELQSPYVISYAVFCLKKK